MSTPQSTIRIKCSFFTKLFLVKEAQILRQEINAHLNEVVDQHCFRTPLGPEKLGLTGYLMNPILQDQQNEMPFKPNASLLMKFADYQEWERKRLTEKALNQYVLWKLCHAPEKDYHAQIATEILEDFSRWEDGANHT